MSERQRLGQAGERAAAAFLERRGYRILDRNYRCRYGEIDCVAVHRGTLVFLEIKTRSSLAYGPPHEAVDLRKRRRLTRIARHYARQKGLLDVPQRFDVVSVHWEGGAPRIELFQNAFDALD